MQAEIDALTVSYGDSGSSSISGNASLADVCLRPMGGTGASACATQSVLQYWSMSREVFDHGGFGGWAGGCLRFVSKLHG